jgi:hypothetical protein
MSFSSHCLQHSSNEHLNIRAKWFLECRLYIQYTCICMYVYMYMQLTSSWTVGRILFIIGI